MIIFCQCISKLDAFYFQGRAFHMELLNAPFAPRQRDECVCDFRLDSSCGEEAYERRRHRVEDCAASWRSAVVQNDTGFESGVQLCIAEPRKIVEADGK